MSLTSLFLSLNLALAPGALRVATTPGIETLAGFPELLSRELSRAFEGKKLVNGTGYPVEPGYYVTMTPNKLQVLDRSSLSLRAGRPAKPRVAPDCRSHCDVALWTLFSGLWAESQRLDARARYVHPRRVLWASSGELDSRSFLGAAYAALETWPQSTLPAMYLLFDAGPGGVRSRQFRLMPPGGVTTASQSAALEFRIRVYPEQRYEFAAQSPQFRFGGTKTGADALQAGLTEVKRRHPGKRAVVIEPMDGTTMSDLAAAMDATLELFPEAILDSSSAH